MYAVRQELPFMQLLILETISDSDVPEIVHGAHVQMPA
jgi:hypothetical protein